MAGGFGSRLRPLTDDCPKPMLKVGPRPLLKTIILCLKSQGFRIFYISTHYMADQVTDHFGDGERFGVKAIHGDEKEVGDWPHHSVVTTNPLPAGNLSLRRI